VQIALPKLWVLRGLKNGILTTKYPRGLPTADEVPPKCVPPMPTSESDWQKGAEICPTGAIEAPHGTIAGKLELGKCIYCQKCATAGFRFSNETTETALKATFQTEAEGNISYKEVLSKYESRWKAFSRSFHVLMIDVGSCNACNMEVLNLSNPYYDLNRLGIFFTNSPKHADALIIVGALNKAMVEVVRRTYELIPNPKLVIAIGACPISGGIFQNTEGFASPVREIIPIDVIVPGCPPSPIQILQGLLIAMGKLKPIEAG
jgi:Ni,Fe-hydrogenase III small subunit